MLPSYVISILTICLTEVSLFGKAGTISVTVEGPSNPVVSGSHVALKCVSTPSGQDQEYEWNKDGNKVENTKSQTYGFHTRKESAGAYYCTFKGTSSAIYRLPIYFPNTKVTFINNPSAPTDPVQAGQVKKFRCETDESKPVATITWHLHYGGNWQNIQNTATPSDRKGSYGGDIRISEWSVTATKVMNGAMVRCTSTYSLKDRPLNPNKTAPANTILSNDTKMNVKFPNTKVTISPTTSSVAVGTQTTLTCQTGESNPVTTMKWYTNIPTGWQELTAEVTTSETNGKYNGKIMTSVWTATATKDMNGKRIKCTSTHPPTGGISETTIEYYVQWPATQLNVVEKPNGPVSLGDTVKLTCQTDNCNPTSLTISWYENGQKITSGATSSFRPSGLFNGVIYENTLMFQATKQNISAKYECKIDGQETLKQEILISDHRPLTDLKMVVQPKAPVKAGSSVTIKCDTNNVYPVVTAATISWYKNGKSISSGVTPKTNQKLGGGVVYESQLTFTAEVDDDQAKYECKINDQAAQRKEVTITVHYAAAWNPGHPKVVIAASEVNKPVTLTLHVIANPAPTVTWFFGSSLATSKGFTAVTVNKTTYTLSKGNIANDDFGKYHAEVKNTVGVSTFTFELTLKGGSTGAASGPPVAIIAGAAGGGVFLLIIIAVIVAVVFILKKKRVDKNADDEDVSPYAETSGVEMTTGFTNVGHDDATDHARYVETGNGQASGVPTGSEYEEVDRNGPTVVTSTPNEAEYAMVEDTSKASKTEPVVCDEYAEVDYNKKTSKKYATPPAPTADGAVYAQVNKKGTQKKPPEPVGLDKKKASEKNAMPTPTAVYAEVNKPKKPGKPANPPKHGPENPADYDDVRIEGAGPDYASVRDVDTDNYASVGDDDDELYGEVRDEDGPGAAGLQPEKSFQVGVDGTIYAGVQMAPPTNPDVIRGQDEPETSYASIDFSREAPPLPQDGGSSKPDHPGFVEFI